MTKNKWLDLVDMIKEKFEIIAEDKESLGENTPGEKHLLEFEGPLGKIRLEFVEKPKLLEVKTLYSARAGSNIKVNKIYDDKEKVSYLNAYKWNEIKQNWENFNFDLNF